MSRLLVLIFAFLAAYLTSLFLFTTSARPDESGVTKEKLILAKEIMGRLDKKVFMDKVIKATAAVTTKIKDLPPGWKEEYIKLWDTEGWDAMKLGAENYLVNHFTKEELQKLKDKKQPDEKLRQKLTDFTAFTQKHGRALGSLYGTIAETNVLLKQQDETEKKKKRE